MSFQCQIAKGMGKQILVIFPWKGSFGTNPKQGLVLFQVQNDQGGGLVLRQTWSINSTPIILKKWSPLFDSSMERMDVAPIWVWLLGLPMEFWTKKSFSEFGNFLGTYLDADMSFLESREMAVARILVSLNIREGLIEELELISGEKSFKQKFDYEGVPFHCQTCH
jgi:hypothetical protein